MRLVRRMSLFLIALMTGASANSLQHESVPTSIPVISLCELLQEPLAYSGKIVTTTVRISRFKEATGIWDPACRHLGADLHTDDSAGSTPGIVRLNQLLNQAGMGDHPVVATLTGKWLPNQHTDSGFLPQPRLVFLVSDASNIGHSKTVERR